MNIYSVMYLIQNLEEYKANLTLTLTLHLHFTYQSIITNFTQYGLFHRCNKKCDTYFEKYRKYC